MIQNSLNRSRLRRVIILIICISISIISESVRAQATLGAREVALGQATSALPNSEWSVFENIALLSDQQPVVSFFGLRYYGLSELTDIAAVITYPTPIGVIGGGIHRYGDDVYNETRLRLAYKNSYQKFYYGLSLTYSHVQIGEGYGSVGALGIDVGIAARITDELWIGAKATNINEPEYGRVNNIDEDLPRNLSIGIAYRFADMALISTDVVKDVAFPISYRGGLEVTIISNLKARAGITTAPQTFSGGFGYDASQWGVNIVVQRHEEKALGYSPGINFNIRW